MSNILIISLILFLVISVYRLNWAVYLILFLLPTYQIRFTVFSIPITLLEAMVLITFLVWFVENAGRILLNVKNVFIRNQEHIKIRYPFDWEMIFLLIISLIAVAMAGFSNPALGIWKAYFFEPILFFILVINVFGPNDNFSLKSLRGIFFTLTVSAFAISLFAIYQKFTGAFIFNEEWFAEATRRVTGPFPYPNALGLFLAPIILMMTGYLFNRLKNRETVWDKINALFVFTTIILSVVALVFARSEGALIGILAGWFVFGLLANRNLRLITVICAILCGIGAFSFQPAREYVWEKVYLSDLSGEIRQQQWRETWKMLSQNTDTLLLGVGLTNYSKAVLLYHQEGIFFNFNKDPDFQRKVVFDKEYHMSHWQPVEIYLYPHNIFLNFWTELGLLGMLLFVWIIVKYIYQGIKEYAMNRNYLVLGITGAMFAIIAHGMVDVPYFKNDLAILFWLMFALLGIFRLVSQDIDDQNYGVISITKIYRRVRILFSAKG